MQEQRKQPEAMFFDMDGTLFRTETLILPAYHAAFDQMKQEGTFKGETPPEGRLLGALGMLLDQIWERVLPEATIAVRNRADELLLRYQLEAIRRGDGEFYEGVVETLEALHAKGIRLFVASNGLEPYVKGIIEAKGLNGLFSGLYSAGEYQTKTKVDLVKLILKHHDIQDAWMVGDRSSDVEAGVNNGLLVVGCDYAGFGADAELAGSTIRIQSFPELLQHV
jgi:phosphoglycolate phosphatase